MLLAALEDDIFHEGRHSNMDDIFHEGRHSNMDDIFHEVFGTTTYTNKDNIVNKNLSIHNHEADTQIPLHVIDVATQGT